MRKLIDAEELWKSMGDVCKGCEVSCYKNDGICAVRFVLDYIDHIADVIVPEATLVTTNEWISVEDKRPEIGEDVLCYTRFLEKYCILTYTQLATDEEPTFRPGDYRPGRDVLYWMPLPEPPEEA